MMRKKIFFVDRYVKYSTELFKELEKNFQNLGNQILFLGPKEISKENFSAQKVINAKRVWGYGKYIKAIYSFIKKDKPDIVHFSFELKTYGPLITLWKFLVLLFLVKKSKIKIILTLHNILVYRENDSWLIHSYILKKIPKFLIKFSLKLFFRIMCSFVDKIIVGTHIGKLALKEFYGISEKKIKVIQLGVNIENQQIGELSKRLEKKIKDKKIILYFGVISPRKGQEMAINAFSLIREQLSDYVLVIAGKAPKEYKNYEENLKRKVKDAGLENNVFFTDFVEDDEIDSLFDNAELALYIYRPMSSSTHALTYALKHSIPVIVSELDTFHEILNNDSALFVEFDNEKKLSESMIKLIKDKELRQTFIENMKDIRIKHDWKKIANEYLKTYEEFSNF